MEKPNNSAGFVCHANPVSGLNHGGGFVEQGGGAIYMECRRNYAASTGGYTVDGCGKFVVKAAGGSNSSNTQGDALLCVTCGCHRSFHRKILLPPRHLWDTYRNYIMNYLRSLPLSVLQSRLPWLLRSPTSTVPNCEPIEGQGSSMGPEEGDQQPGSDSSDEINQPNKKRIRKELKN